MNIFFFKSAQLYAYKCVIFMEVVTKSYFLNTCLDLEKIVFQIGWRREN